MILDNRIKCKVKDIKNKREEIEMKNDLKKMTITKLR